MCRPDWRREDGIFLQIDLDGHEVEIQVEGEELPGDPADVYSLNQRLKSLADEGLANAIEDAIEEAAEDQYVEDEIDRRRGK